MNDERIIELFFERSEEAISELDKKYGRACHAVSYNINGILNHPQWIDEFHANGTETFLWMVNTPYLYNLAKEFGFTWVTTDFYDEIIK